MYCSQHSFLAWPTPKVSTRQRPNNFALCVDTEFDFTQKTITGAGFKDTADFSGLKYLSLAGGAPILLSGLNFASQASWNSFKFEPGFQEGFELWGPDMTSKFHPCFKIRH